MSVIQFSFIKIVSSQDDFKYTQTAPVLSGTSSIAVDIKNNYVFLKNNSYAVLPIASLTKFMTALITTEYINLDNIATVPKEAIVYTSKARLQIGQQISIYQLLYPLLMESSNEAAETIARYYGRDEFIKHMNEKAASLGMTHTHFADVSGASEDNTSTVEDLVTLAKYIYNNRQFILNITADKVKNSSYEPNMFTDMTNVNDFVDNPNFVGGKVGKTTAAKETEISIFDLPVINSTSTRPIVMITLGSNDRKNDTQLMLNYVLNNYFNK
jgi:D-alanyl-D-alanine carboxypeptidase